MDTAAAGTWASHSTNPNLQDFNSNLNQINANSQTNHNSQHAVIFTNQQHLIPSPENGDRNVATGAFNSSKLQQLLGDSDDYDVTRKSEKSKNPLSKWFSSLTKKRKNKAASRPMVEILFDQEYSRDDSLLDDSGFVPEYRRRKYSDPTGTGNPPHFRYGSLDRRPWIRSEVNEDSMERRQYGSLDRRTQSQILTRWNGTTMQDLRFDDAEQQNLHHYHGSSLESEPFHAANRQQKPHCDMSQFALTADKPASINNQFWSLPRPKAYKLYPGSSTEESNQFSDVTLQDSKLPQIDNQDEVANRSSDMSLPRNFKLKNGNVEGIDACDNLCSIPVPVVGQHLSYVVVWHDFVEKYKLFINC